MGEKGSARVNEKRTSLTSDPLPPQKGEEVIFGLAGFLKTVASFKVGLTL
jgi:hypothetical protein